MKMSRLATSFDLASQFIRENTAPARVPFVPELQLYTASQLTRLWQATAEELSSHDLDVPFWSVPWAGGQALARYVLDRPTLVQGRRVLDFACGSGLVAIAAARAGAEHVAAVDIDPVCLVAVSMNATLNGTSVAPMAVATDNIKNDGAANVVAASSCRQVTQGPAAGVGLWREDLGALDVILAGDVFYDRHLAAGCMAWFRDLVRDGVTVLVGDPQRSYAPASGLSLCNTYDIPTSRELEDSDFKRTHVWQVR